MNLRLLVASLLFICTFAHGAEPAPLPKALAMQVERLVALVKDSYATGYPEAAMTQTLDTGEESQVTLVVFTVEGFGMGNNYSQYLAAFTPSENEEGVPYYSLLDVVRMGGDSWRAIETLNAKLVSDPAGEQTLIDIPAMENTADDDANSPSKPVVIHLSLEGSQAQQLVEVK